VKIISASFFWRNDQPDGLGVTFGPPAFTSEELTDMFRGDVVRDYIRASDKALGTDIVRLYLIQLEDIARQAKQAPLPLHAAILAALNIMYLAERGFIPNDEFNGPMFVQAE
jgi:hypothetical protein